MARTVHLSYRALLLASAAGLVWSSAAHAADFNNTSPQSGTSTLFTLDSGDNLTNSSSITITNGAVPAVRVSPVAAGTITNSGTIASFGSPGTAISVGGTLTSLTNSGLIAADADNSRAIDIPSGGAIGTLLNSSGGTISANGANGIAVNVLGRLLFLGNVSLIRADGSGGTAVAVTNGGSLGSVTNNGVGTIEANGSNGRAISVGSGGVVGVLSNTGTVQATGTGGQAVSVAGSLGILANGGLIRGGVAGIVDAGSIGHLGNSGTISASAGTAISIASGATLGGISNNALIQGSTAISNYGSLANIVNTGTGMISGAVINQGRIGDTGTVAVANGGTITSLLNTGSIIEPNGTALLLNGGRISGGIANTAGALIQGGASDGSGTAIDNSAGADALVINNQGTVVGGIRLGTHGDVLSIIGGRITGNITGLGTSDTVVYALGNTGSFTTGGSISGVGTINVASGTVNFQNSIASAMAFSVNSGATAMLNPGAPIAAASFNNAGAVSVGTGAATVTGNYTQASTGTLKISVTNTGVGSLGVSGTASIAQPANAVAAHVPTTIIIAPLVGTSFTVLSASGGLSVNNPSALTASSDSGFLSFNLAEVGNTLVLTPRLPTFAESLANIEAAIDSDYTLADGIFPPNANDLEGRRFMAYILAGLSSTGQGQLAETYLNILGNLANSPGLLIQLEKAIVPNAITSALLNFAGSVGSFSTSSSNIHSRLTMMRSLDTGLAAGDEVARGIQAWIQPFGSFLNQDAKEGIDGYSMSTYGATMGGDMLVTPDLRLGMALTLANNDVSYNGFTSGSKASAFNVQLGLYGQYYIQNFFIDGLLSFGYNKYSSNTQLAAFGLTRNADYGGTQFGAKIGAGYDFKLPNAVVITPYASVQQLHMNFNSYTTTGAFPFNMHVPSASADVTTTSLGVRVAYPVKLSMGTLTPEIHANWFHNFGTDQLATTYSSSDVTIPAPFINAFTFRGPHSDRDVFNIGVSANLAQSGPWTFGAGYDFAGRSSSSQHLFYLRAKYSF